MNVARCVATSIAAVGLLLNIGPLAHIGRGQEDTSKTKFVCVENAKVYCGPSTKFYTTRSLSRGASVEVYHETKDGWSAIRPPEGSFSWLAAEAAYLLPGGKTCEIAENPVPSWIGTTEEAPKQFRWQVQLQPTQVVQVIEEVTQEINSSDKKLWYKIAPPTGEFRWVRSELLGDEPPSPRQERSTDRNGKKSLLARSDSKSKNDDPVQTASHQMPVEGATIVWSDEAEMLRREDIVEGGVYDEHGNLIEGPMEIDGEVVEGAEEFSEMGAPIPSRNQPLITHLHEDERFKSYSAFQSHGYGFRLRPLEKFLGYIGFSVVEVDKNAPKAMFTVDPPVDGGTSMLTNHRGGLANDPVAQSRLDMLPRPSRRVDRQRQALDRIDPSSPYYDPYSSTIETWPAQPMGSGPTLVPNSSAPSTQPSNIETLPRPSSVPAGQIPSADKIPSGLRSLLQPMSQINTSDVGRGLATGERTMPSAVDAWSGADGRATSLSQTAAIIDTETVSSPLNLSTPDLLRAQIELSRIVAAPTEQWDLRRVKQTAEEWVERGSTPLARGEARLLLDRIQQFESLRFRTANVGTFPAPMPATATRASATAPVNGGNGGNGGWQVSREPGVVPAVGTGTSAAGSDPSIMTASVETAKHADISGWLVKVHTSLPGQPEYALADTNGTLLTYVQPAPGVNLGLYAKSPVAIYGTKGYIPELAARQIVADRVVRLR